MMPRQFGPTTRMPVRRASSTTRSSRAAPSSPTSLKPAEMTTAVGTPASPHSAMIPGIEAGGVTMMARSTCSGIEATFGWHWTPRMLGRLGLTG